MATQLSLQGVGRPAPRWWRNLERGLLMVLIPAIIAVISSWKFQDEKFALRLTLIINVLLVATIKFIGMTIFDPEDNYVSNLTAVDQNKIQDINPPKT